MRIAIVGPTFPYKGGGAQHTTELAHRLSARGHDGGIEAWRGGAAPARGGVGCRGRGGGEGWFSPPP